MSKTPRKSCLRISDVEGYKCVQDVLQYQGAAEAAHADAQMIDLIFVPRKNYSN